MTTATSAVTRTSRWLALPALLGLVAAGCSGGGGGGSTAAGATAMGAVTSRSVAGYAWTSVDVGAAGGFVAAIAALPSDVVLAADSSAPQVAVVQGGALVGVEGGFVAPVVGFADDGGELLAATAGGAGDVWRRTPAGWQLALDGPGDAAAVGVAGGVAQAAASDGAGGALVSALGAAGAQPIGPLPRQATPTAAAPFGIDLWVGAEAQGGAALFQVAGGAVTEVPLPVSAPVAGSRQRVTALVPMPAGLAIAVGTFDAADRPLGGEVLLWSQAGVLQGLLSLTDDAPLALAKQDGTLYVGTRGGRLLWADGAGAFMDEPLLPANGGVHALLAPDAATLLVGVRGASGPALLRRTALAGGAGTSGPSGPDYVHDAKPILLSRCAGCHATMSTGWRVSAGLTNDAADYQATLPQVSTADPDASTLLRKCSNLTTHGGGQALGASSPEYATLRAWIAAGAPFSSAAATTTPTTPTTPATPPAAGTGGPDYLHEAVAILAPRCSGCHATQSTGWRVSANMASTASDYQVTLPKVDVNAPASSLLLTKASGQAHGGGTVIAATSAEYAGLRAWIAAGAKYDTRPAGTPPPPPPGPPANPTYVRDIEPVLASCVGCHVRVGDYPLSQGLTQDSADYQSTLRQVNLTTPASSRLLRRPTSTNDHPVKVFDTTSLQYQTLLRWIQQGAKF